MSGDETPSIAGRAIVGLVSPATGWALSHLPEIEAWLRVASLAVGIAVGLASLWSILRNRKRKN